jgi:carbamoyltransferase
MKNKFVLGLHLLHTSTAALINENGVVSIFSEERLNRKKVYSGFPILSVKKILELSNINPKDICLVTIPSIEIDIVDKSIHSHIFKESFVELYNIIVKECGFDVKKSLKYVLSSLNIDCEVKFYDHHMSHAASGYYSCNFTEALMLTADGHGDDLCMSVSIEKSNSILRLDEVNKFYSIGRFYSFITYLLGFTMLKHEGKITGLAAFGDASKLSKKFRIFLDYDKNTNEFNSEIFDELTQSKNKWLLRFKQRASKLVDENTIGGWLDYGFVEELRCITKDYSKEDIAAGAQGLLEEIVVDYVSHWQQKTNKTNLILAGGVFANVKLNQRLLEIKGIKNIYIHPGMGDEGLSLGSAYLGMNEINGFVQRKKLSNVYFGESFSLDYIKTLLENCKEIFEYKEYAKNEITKIVAKKLEDEQIVAIFTGAMEYGPRALGARTIMANAKRNSINDTLNKRLRRTEFMPFAPVVLDKYAKDIFTGLDGAEYTAEFMTITCDVKNEWKDKISATVHVDGTARPQIIRREENSLYYDTLEEFYKLTGVPVLVNTSFNLHEEPIVDSPESALKALSEGAMDYLMLENFLVKVK